MLGCAYEKRDRRRGAGLFVRACDGGSAFGCVNAGVAQSKGWTGPKDEAAGLKLFEKACALGRCSNVGFAHANGRGTPKDMGKAVEVWAKSCESGESVSCLNLGYIYERGKGVGKDQAASGHYFEKARQGGIDIARPGVVLSFVEVALLCAEEPLPADWPTKIPPDQR